MANTKTGLLYYTSDTSRFKDDIRIKRLKKDMGCDGYAVYEYILNEIYRVGGCFLVWDESTAFDVAEYWGLKETKVNEIVRYCCAVGLFDKNVFDKCNILTNLEIQKKWVKMTLFANIDDIPEGVLLIDDKSIPFYKRNKRGRIQDKNYKLWKEIVKQVFLRDNYTCQYCGKRGGKLEADHIIPFSKGGSDDMENLTTACRTCNRQKRDKSVEEFLIWRQRHGTSKQNRS